MKTNKYGRVLSFLIVAAVLPSCNAALEWQQNTLSTQAAPGDLRAENTFVFTNTSAETVEIIKVATSCGCTTATPSKMKIQPGETGTLKTVFTFGERKGSQEKTVLIQYTKGNPDLLTLRVRIPDTVEINPDSLSWKTGQPFKEQAFEITVTGSGLTQVKSAKSLSKNFTAELQEIKPGKNYRVAIRPLAGSKAVKGSIRLDLTDPRPRTIYLKVVIE